MIEAIVLDINGLSMCAGDVVQVTYPNEKFVSIGSILWDDRDLTIKVHFGDDGFESLSVLRNSFKVECIGSLKNNSKFAKYMAKHKFKNGKAAERFVDAMNSDLLDLPLEQPRRKQRPIGGVGAKLHRFDWMGG